MTYVMGIVIVWTILSFIAVALFAILLGNALDMQKAEFIKTRPAVRALADARVRDLMLQLAAKVASLFAGVMVSGEILFHWWDAPSGGAAIALMISLASNTAVGLLNARDDERWRRKFLK
jgi:hypothetical protein